MSTTSTAKMNAKIFRQILPKLKKANIILIGINHITQKVEINPMVHTKAAINYLKQDEALVGGNTPIYLANNIIKLEAGQKLKSDELFGINGFTVKMTLIKSRSNRAGQEVELVYDQVNGIDNHLSNLLYLKNNKILEGAGIGLHLPDSEVKFRLSTFKDKLKDKEFRKLYRKLIITSYRGFIDKKELDEDIESSNEEEETVTETKIKRKKK